MNQQPQNPVRRPASHPAPISTQARPAPAKLVVDAGAATEEKSEQKSEQKGSESVQRRQRHRRETRAQLLERLLNPQVSLHEASMLLRVCPATVRNYADSGLLPHVRTTGRQRRFYLRDVLALLRQLD